MYMQGFVSYVTGKYRTDGGSTTPSCLNLWFEDWVLDSEGKFAAACFGCILLGVITESVSHLRRLVKAYLKGENDAIQVFIMCTLYGVQLSFGYLSMLVAMTYQVELFVCIVFGLAAGHGIFSFKPNRASPNLSIGKNEIYTPVDKGFDHVSDDMVDPCCAYMNLDEDSDAEVESGKNAKNAKNSNGVTKNPVR